MKLYFGYQIMQLNSGVNLMKGMMPHFGEWNYLNEKTCPAPSWVNIAVYENDSREYE